MTTFEAIVSMSLLVLKQRSQWQGAATAHDDIDRAVNQCADMLPQGTRDLCDMAVAELKRRAGYPLPSTNGAGGPVGKPAADMLTRATTLIAKCERDLKRQLDRGQRVDLLCDNTDWSLALCQTVVDNINAEQAAQ